MVGELINVGRGIIRLSIQVVSSVPEVESQILKIVDIKVGFYHYLQPKVINCPKRRHPQNIIWFNPPFSKSVQTPIGEFFFYFFIFIFILFYFFEANRQAFP